jgi:hypothetical protein
MLTDPSTSGGIRAADHRSLVSLGENSQTPPSFRLGLPRCLQEEARSVSEESNDLAKPIERLFASDRYASLDRRRQQIRDSAEERHSWDLIAQLTMNVNAGLPQVPSPPA